MMKWQERKRLGVRFCLNFGKNMSRIGKKTIKIPENTEIKIQNGILNIKGPKGELNRILDPNIDIKIEGEDMNITLKNDKNNNSLWGTYSAHISNMIKGVNSPFTKKLILEGIGYKADVKGDNLVMALGFSHPVNVLIPKSLSVTSEKGIITVTGIDKEEVGFFSAKIRDFKKPEPYKGKGIRYENEVIKRKQGKKSA